MRARAIFSPLDALKLSRRARNLRRGISERALADSNVDQPTLVVELIRVALQARETTTALQHTRCVPRPHILYNISTTLYNTQHFQYSLQLYSISTVYTLYNTPLSPSLRACRRRWLAWRLMPSIIRHYDADHLPIRCAPCAASRSVFDRCRASMRARSVFGGGGDSVSVRTANESSAVSSADSISRSAT